MTEDAIHDGARSILGVIDSDMVRSGIGQLTKFTWIGFLGVVTISIYQD